VLPDPPAEPHSVAGSVTVALADLQRGLPGAADRVAALVYEELHRIAERAMRRESDGHTLQPTELVSEAFMRLVDQQRVDWQSRAHFYAVAARTIRRILVDHARAKRRVKRDHGFRVTFDEAIGGTTDDLVNGLDLIALDDALTRLQEIAPRHARVVELRFFGGLEIEETGEALGISPATVKRDWTFARAFLLRALDASVS
jgi:RNA polymerase sigma-70 factor, ECF subfamily